jgi:hypothetical protein
MENAKNTCLLALKTFIEVSSNENKMELIIEYDEIDELDRASVLGDELNAALSRIVLDNFHPDEFLEELKNRFF